MSKNLLEIISDFFKGRGFKNNKRQWFRIYGGSFISL